MKALLKKELQYYFNNPIGYIVIGLFAVSANFLYLKDLFAVGSASLQPFFGILPWLSLIFIPAITMRMFAEEKRTNTIELLLSFPISELQIVVAKFLALCLLILIGLGLTLALPVSLAVLTKLYLPEILVGYFGTFLFMASFCGISLFFSAQTKNQVVALLISVVVLFILVTLGSDFLSNILPQALQNTVSMVSPTYHLQNFVKGVIDIRSLFYFISLIAVGLFMTIISIEKRD